MITDKALTTRSATGRFARFTGIFCLTLAVLVLGACAKMEGKVAAKAPVNPNDVQMAYNAVITVPSNWQTAALLAPEAAAKAGLETRVKGGERVLLLAATGTPSPKGVESIMMVFLVNEENTFMPREFAEKLKPEEFAGFSRDLFEREKATAKKNKAKFNLMDLQLSRDTIGGHFAIQHKITVADEKGVPLRSLRWDIYLPGGVGIAVRAECDMEQSAMENEIVNMVRSLRVQP
ncbi:MAG: hypothetical protein LBH65_04205 [Desulfovibrio sp.]|jgi:hypothetical protein|nr:hypothetical protein [Desulfovibrio sp.]